MLFGHHYGMPTQLTIEEVRLFDIRTDTLCLRASFSNRSLTMSTLVSSQLAKAEESKHEVDVWNSDGDGNLIALCMLDEINRRERKERPSACLESPTKVQRKRPNPSIKTTTSMRTYSPAHSHIC